MFQFSDIWLQTTVGPVNQSITVSHSTFSLNLVPVVIDNSVWEIENAVGSNQWAPLLNWAIPVPSVGKCSPGFTFHESRVCVFPFLRQFILVVIYIDFFPLFFCIGLNVPFNTFHVIPGLCLLVTEGMITTLRCCLTEISHRRQNRMIYPSRSHYLYYFSSDVLQNQEFTRKWLLFKSRKLYCTYRPVTCMIIRFYKMGMCPQR